MSKKYLISILILLSSFSLYGQYGKNIASLPFRGKDITKEESEYLASMFATEFVARGYTLVSRTSALEEVYGEIEYQRSCATSAAIEAGKQLGADYVIVGNIDYVFGRLALTTQIISVEQSRIIASANEQINDVYSINQELAAKMVKKIVLDMSIAL